MVIVAPLPEAQPSGGRPSRASKVAARNVIAAVTGRKRTNPGEDDAEQPSRAIKKAKASKGAPRASNRSTHTSARTPTARKSAGGIPKTSNIAARGKSTARVSIPRVDVPEDSPIELSDIEASDDEPLIVSLSARSSSKSKLAKATYDDVKLDEGDEGEEASSADGSYSPNEGSIEGSGSDNEDMSGLDEEDEDDMLTQDLNALEARLAAEKPEWQGEEDDNDDDIPPVLRRKQKKDKGKAKALTVNNSSSDSETEMLFKRALMPRQASQRQEESGRLTGSKAKPPTERQLLERPTWNIDNSDLLSDHSVHYHGIPSNCGSVVDADEVDEDDVVLLDNIQAPVTADDIPDVLPAASYELVLPAAPGAHLHLLPQHLHVRGMLQSTFLSAERSLVRDNAFPLAPERHALVLKGMLDGCTDRGYTGLYTRISTDIPFRKSLAALANQRISTFRSNLKKVTDPQVGPFYGLKPGTACAEKVQWLLGDLRYIYPHSYEKGTADWKQPFRHLAIPSIMHAAFFSGASAVGIREQDSSDMFESSRHDRPDEQEVPIPMLALIGAAIHASLSEWKTGYHKKSFFTADASTDAYKEHVTVLRGIKQANPNGYHFMMHWLFNEASGAGQGATITSAVAASALAMIDFANMQVD